MPGKRSVLHLRLYVLLFLLAMFPCPHAGLCVQAGDAPPGSIAQADEGPGSSASSEKLYGALSGYLEVFTRKQDLTKRRPKGDSRTRYRGAGILRSEPASFSSEIHWNLAEKRIEREEFDLAVYPLERALEAARSVGTAEEASLLQKMLQEIRTKPLGDSRPQPAARGAVNSIGMRLTVISPGTFSMGSSEAEVRRIQAEWSAAENVVRQESPAHSIQISNPFLIGTYHVTVGQFKAFVDETGHRTQAETQGWGWVYDEGKKHWVKKSGASWKNPGFEVWPDQPVTMVCYADAEAFCAWLSRKENRKYHLPTEAQWEYAARGGKEGERFPWGNDYPDGKKLNMADWRAPVPWGDRTMDDGYAKASPVGSYEPNGFGLYDMVGNLWQLCYDYYDAKIYEQSKSQVTADPAGPRTGKEIIVRGGNWAFGAGIGRNAFRSGIDPHMAADVCGFRVAAALTSQEFRDFQTASDNLLKTDDLARLMERLRSLAGKGKRLEARKLIEQLNVPASKDKPHLDPGFFIKTLLDDLIDGTKKKESESFVNSTGMTMVRIPAGSFLMGSSDTDIAWALKTLAPGQPVNLENETPLRKVRISRPFLISSTPVTVGQFRRFVEETGYVTDAEEDGGGLVYNLETLHFERKPGTSWKNPGWPVTDDQPVTMVTYNDAEAFVDWLTAKEKLPYKLPTEAQWEYSARGGLASPRFPWGDTAPDGRRANYADKNKQFLWRDSGVDCGYPHVSPVGTYPANGFGLYDMAGNVLQWVRDYYLDDYYAYAPEIDPEGPAKGEFRVMKGGDWTSGPVRLRCAFRGRARPDLALYNSGFRVVIELGSPLREFHFAQDFLTKEWVPGPQQRAVTEIAAKEKERLRHALPGSKSERAPATGKTSQPMPVKGAYILDFGQKSSARKAGMTKGDVIIEYNGVGELTADKLFSLSSTARAGKKAPQVVFVRDGSEYSVTLPPGPLGAYTTDIIIQGPFKKSETGPRVPDSSSGGESSRRDWM